MISAQMYKQLQYTVLLFFYCILPSAIVNFYMYKVSSQIKYLDSIANGYLVAFLILILTFILLQINKNLLFISSMLLYIPTIINVMHIKQFGTFLGSTAYYAIFETNLTESKEYIENILLFDNVLLFTLVTVIFVMLTLVIYNIVVKFNAKFFIIIFVCSFTIIVCSITYKVVRKQSYVTQLNTHPLFSMANAYFYYNKDLNYVKAYHEKKVSVYDNITVKSDMPQNYVFIIGESSTTLHSSLYGYHRETNPYLSARDDIFVFKDVVSAAEGTWGSIKTMLSFENCNNDSLSLYEGSIFTVFNSAGFETYWLGNQLVFGNPGSIPAIFVTEANHAKLTSKSNDYESVQTLYDELLLAELDNVLRDNHDRRFIVMHLMGSHTRYEYRYPSNFRHFQGDVPGKENLSQSKKNTINDYDNSIRYTDYIVNEVIEKIKKVNGLSYVFYISDHGEDVYDFTDNAGHGHTKTFTPNIYSVPLIAWFSEKYLQLNSGFSERPEYFLRHYQADDINYFLIELSGITFKHSKPYKNVLSDKWIFKPRIICLEKNYDYDKELEEWINR
ncbi:MAG: phosphoethanolamine transferase [Deferribacteraceae bacterium]|jgi:heptose-I-phosphate ethanolaminephosphotransferase|nr:phosphoethanolamine transferase [Deferribacteraceae bacterium]